jgi:hypothetical protein
MKYYIIFAIAIVILMLYLILSNYNYRGKSKCCECEGFTPKVRQAFRPYFRDTRNYCEGFYNNTKNRVSRFLRNIGLF